MRKQYKNKRRSCALCKPHKRGHEHRWKPFERDAQRAAAIEIRHYRRNSFDPSP